MPAIPYSEIHRIDGSWSSNAAAQRRGEWARATSGAQSVSEQVLVGELEVLAVPGTEAFPCLEVR